MAYNYTTPFGYNAKKLAPAPNAGSNLIGDAAGAALGIATGGTSDILSGVLNVIPSIFQSIIGGKQLRDAAKIEASHPRPEAVVAPAVNKAVNYAYGQTLNQDIPGGEIARNEIKGATSAGIKAASELGSGAEAYGALGQLVGREQDQFARLAEITAQDVAGKKNTYLDTLGNLANEQNRVWDWNQAQPYLQAAQIAAQLRNSGMSNLYSGVANTFGSAAEYTSPDFNSSLMLGSNNKGTPGEISIEDLTKILDQIKS